MDQKGPVGEPTKAHINPKFLKGEGPKVHVNPNVFPKANNPNAGRTLPPLPDASVKPHVNPNFIDKAKTKAYKDSIVNAVQVKAKDEGAPVGKVFINPNFKRESSTSISSNTSSSSEKENKLITKPTFSSPATKAAKNPIFTPKIGAKKSIFKLIGSKKLVRVNTPSPAKPLGSKKLAGLMSRSSKAKTPILSSSVSSDKNLASTDAGVYKLKTKRKIVRVSPKTSPVISQAGTLKETPLGSKKLAGLMSRSSKAKTPILSSSVNSRRKLASTDAGVYKLKTKQKIVRVSPKTSPAISQARTPRRLFATPLGLSSKFRKGTGSPRNRTPFSGVLNQFRIDRRKPAAVKKQLLIDWNLENLDLAKSRGVQGSPKVRCSPPKRAAPPPPKPVRNRKPTTTLLRIDGVRYSMSTDGRRLQALKPKETEEGTGKALPPPSTLGTRYQSQRRKFYLEGEEYVGEGNGILVRSRNSMTRASINSAKARSINTILKSQTRSRQYCMFFNKFGKCNKKDKGICPYIHDQEKVAVCRKFLNGACTAERCLLSHKVAPEKMPSCKFFLEGVCTRDNCPYRHVKVNDAAEICQEYLKGFCPAGSECKKRHEDIRRPKSESSAIKAKKVPPLKPKRKSLSAVNAKTPKVQPPAEPASRYYDDGRPGDDDADDEDDQVQPSSPRLSNDELEAKRQRLMKKVELAKQGWLPPEPQILPGCESPNDSGPYERIDEDESDAPKRPPVGKLPSYISLSKYSDEEEVKKEEDELKEILNATVAAAGSENQEIVLEAEEDCEERLI